MGSEFLVSSSQKVAGRSGAVHLVQRWRKEVIVTDSPQTSVIHVQSSRKLLHVSERKVQAIQIDPQK